MSEADPQPPAGNACGPGPCPLCGGARAAPFADLRHGRYHHCPDCDLVFQDRTELPDPVTEREHYLLHDNRVDDPGYRRFLARLAEPLMAELSPGARGLDFGCGPGPALAAILTEAGFPTAVWDPFFATDPAPLGERYDFVTCTETIEHFHEPGRELDRLAGLLEAGGRLAVMTEIREPERPFGQWWYPSDPTHVAFYSRDCLAWIADHYGWRLHCPARTVAVFRAG